MAAQDPLARAWQLPFYRYPTKIKRETSRRVLSFWHPGRTHRNWEDWTLGERYALHFIEALRAGGAMEHEFVMIVSAMGEFMKNSDYTAIGFLDTIIRQVHPPGNPNRIA